MTARTVIQEGQTITCPKCGKRIATALRDVHSHEMMKSSAFESHIGDLTCSEPMCPDDNVSYVRTMAGGKHLHTTKGWT